jgi:hypothetical protein
MKKYSTLIIVAVFLFTGLSGCIGVNRSFKELRNYLVQNLDEDLNREIEFSVGPAGMMFAGMFLSVADTGMDITDMVRKVDRIQLSVFNRKAPGKADFGLLKEITDRMAEMNLKYVVRAKDGSDMSAVFLSQSEDDINKLFVISLSEDNLVLVEILGDIDELIKIAIKEHGLNLNYAFDN